MPSDLALTPSEPKNDRAFFLFNGGLSAGALAFLAWLLLIHPGGGGGVDLSYMPGVNAALNATATVLLIAGWVAIRRRRPDIHRYLMVSAFAASALFLVGYVAYHYVEGDTKYGGEGALRWIYFAILISHVLLSMTVVPLALTTFYLAFRRRFHTHRRVARVTLPIWLYVSITGVVIYFMLHVFT